MNDQLRNASAEILDWEPFKHSLMDFARPVGPDLLRRTQPFLDWTQVRRDSLVWPYNRVLDSAPTPVAAGRDDSGRTISGLNFGSQDYLGLSSHPKIREGALEALQEWGPHSASSGALQGNTRISLQLENALGEFLQMENVMLFPTGWAAGFGTVVGLVRPHDHVVMDKLAHACLQQGATAATQRVLRHDHLDVEGARQHLRQIREEDKKGGILVITEGLFSMDLDVPRIDALQAACREYGATLLVDVAHDLGALGPEGTGTLGVQKVLGKVDLVMGAFSKTFASNGGFLASRLPTVTQYVRFFGGSWAFSNALSPVQAAVVLAALRIVDSPEGAELREHTMKAIRAMRAAFEDHGITCLGEPSPIVPVLVGNEAVARLAYRLLRNSGVMASLVEFPGVAVGKARFRMQVMASHSLEQVTKAAHIVSEAISEANDAIGRNIPTPGLKSDQPHSSSKQRRAADRLGAEKSPVAMPVDLLSKGKRKSYRAGEQIIGEGTQPQAVFVVRSGTVRVQMDHLGSPVRLSELGRGEMFGEMSFFTEVPASASVIAVDDVELDVIDRATLNNATANDPRVAAEFYRHAAYKLADRLRFTSQDLVSIANLVANAG